MRGKLAQNRAISEYYVPINDAVAGGIDRLFRNIGIHRVRGQGSRAYPLPRFSLFCYPVTLQLLWLYVTLAYG
jgi:hypothetical protein